MRKYGYTFRNHEIERFAYSVQGSCNREFVELIKTIITVDSEGLTEILERCNKKEHMLWIDHALTAIKIQNIEFLRIALTKICANLGFSDKNFQSYLMEQFTCIEIDEFASYQTTTYTSTKDDKKLKSEYDKFVPLHDEHDQCSYTDIEYFATEAFNIEYDRNLNFPSHDVASHTKMWRNTDGSIEIINTALMNRGIYTNWHAFFDNTGDYFQLFYLNNRDIIKK